MTPTIDYQRITDLLATAIESLTEEERFLLETITRSGGGVYGRGLWRICKTAPIGSWHKWMRLIKLIVWLGVRLRSPP